MNKIISSSSESDYQRNASRAAAKYTPIHESPGGMPIPVNTRPGITNVGYQRNPKVGAAALNHASFSCEIDPRHSTFISNTTGKPYVEAHHLIPFGSQPKFKFSLDVTANIVALCPNCHRRLHHGKGDARIKEIESLFKKRKDRLEGMSLSISRRDLIKLYKADLPDDEL